MTPEFKKRCSDLYNSQVSRARQKIGPSGRISKRGYVLPFDRQRFAVWLGQQFPTEVIRCPYCTVHITVDTCVIDHQIPLSRGGNPELSNLAPICEPCNNVKGKLCPDEFRMFRQFMYEMGNKFGNDPVKDITSRLAKAVSLAAMARRNISMSKRVARQAVTPQVTSFDDSDF